MEIYSHFPRFTNIVSYNSLSCSLSDSLVEVMVTGNHMKDTVTLSPPIV